MKPAYLLALFCLPITAFSANPQCAQPNKHVILIGLDGVRADAFNKALKEMSQTQDNAALTKFINHSATADDFFAGGILKTPSQQLTLSEPGWTTILTGVWADHHHIRFNSDLKRAKYNHNIPTLYNIIKDNFIEASTASFTDWEPLYTLATFTSQNNDAADINELFPFQHDDELNRVDGEMTSAVTQTIQQKSPPTFIFAHYLESDEIGHRSGFDPNNPDYMLAIKHELNHINKIIIAISKSIQNGNQWLTIITTDHGGHKNVHGTELAIDRKIFAVFQANNTLFSNGIKINLHRGQTDFVPTILNYLGINTCSYQLDGKSL